MIPIKRASWIFPSVVLAMGLWISGAFLDRVNGQRRAGGAMFRAERHGVCECSPRQQLQERETSYAPSQHSAGSSF